MEKWDAYYGDESPAGCDIVRGQAIAEGLYHLVSEILVRHIDGDYLLMQRDWQKDAFPGLFEASAGGAVQKGETPLEAAVRELREETGIEADELVPLYRCCDGRHAIYYGYLCVTDWDKSAVTLQEGETIDYRWVSEGELLEFAETEAYVSVKRERQREYFKQILAQAR